MYELGKVRLFGYKSHEGYNSHEGPREPGTKVTNDKMREIRDMRQESD